MIRDPDISQLATPITKQGRTLHLLPDLRCIINIVSHKNLQTVQGLRLSLTWRAQANPRLFTSSWPQMIDEGHNQPMPNKQTRFSAHSGCLLLAPFLGPPSPSQAPELPAVEKLLQCFSWVRQKRQGHQAPLPCPFTAVVWPRQHVPAQQLSNRGATSKHCQSQQCAWLSYCEASTFLFLQPCPHHLNGVVGISTQLDGLEGLLLTDLLIGVGGLWTSTSFCGTDSQNLLRDCSATFSGPRWTWLGFAPRLPGTFSGTFSGTLLNLTWLCPDLHRNLLRNLLRNPVETEWLCTKASHTFSGTFGTFSRTSLNLTRRLHQVHTGAILTLLGKKIKTLDCRI